MTNMLKPLSLLTQLVFINTNRLELRGQLLTIDLTTKYLRGQATHCYKYVIGKEVVGKKGRI